MDMSQSGGVQAGSLSTSSGGTAILPESQSRITQTGTTTTTSSGEIITNTGTTSIISSDTASGRSVSGSYMIIAGYVASNTSGSTPINLTTTLTHIMLGDERIATFQTQTNDTPKTSDDEKLVYHISDHLNSSSLDLSNTGIVLQASDYEPFGKSITYEVTSKRIKGKKGGYTNKYLFANKQLDDETDLQYFEKRYYDNRIGKFTTEDPVFWEVGFTKRPSQYFSDPQGWNTYAYTENNPINLVDPSGEQDIGWWIQNTIASAFDGSIPTEVQGQLTQEASAYKQAGKEIGTFIVKNSPGTGDIGDAYNTVAGIDFYTGKKISSEDRIISGLAMVIPGVSGKGIKKGGDFFADLTNNQIKNLSRFMNKIPANSKDSIEIMKSGSNFIFKATSPGNVAGSKAVYEKIINSAGTTISFLKTTFDPKGNIVHVKDKINGTIISNKK